MSGRVTKLVCPSCEGSGRFSPVMALKCMWCKGEKRIPVADALQYAQNAYVFAGGGFLNGDYSFDEMVERERKAERIYDLAGAQTPWQRRAALQEKEAGE